MTRTRANRTQTRKRRGFDHSKTVGQDGDRISLARLSVHGIRYASENTTEARGSGHQSIGQDRQTARHRLQSCQEFTRQVESRCQDDQGHRQVTGE